LGGRNADGSQRLLTRRAQRAQRRAALRVDFA
jgi:hypothetical protein